MLARNIKGVNEPGAAHPYAHLLGQKGEEWRSRLQIRRLLDDTPERWRGALTLPYHINPMWRRAIRDLVVKDGCQLLIVRDMPLVLAATTVGKRTGVPVIFDMAENYPAAMAAWRRYEGMYNYIKNSVVRNVTMARIVERRCIHHSDHIFVVVEESAQRVKKLLKNEAKVTVIENTPDLESYEVDYSHTEPVVVRNRDLLVIVYVGEIHAYRGISTCLEASRLLRVRGEGICWWLVGTGKHERYFRHCSADLESQRVLYWFGWQPHHRALLLINLADIGIVPHVRTEHWQTTMPNKLYDYMAFRKPVLVSDCRPMKRVVETYQCGLVFRSQDAEDLAEKVLMLRDPELRAQMGANGRRAVEEQYNWGVDGKRLVEVVEALLLGSE